MCFYIMELLLSRTHLHRTSRIPICAFVLDHTNHFFISAVYLFYCCYYFHLSIFASFDKVFLCGTSLLFCTEYIRNIHLLCSRRADMLKKWKLHHTSDHETEVNLSSLTVDRCRVDVNVSATMHLRKKTTPLDTFFMFYCKLLFIFCCWKENSIYLWLLKIYIKIYI